MALFTKRTPGECIDRVSLAMNEVESIQNLLDATSKDRSYKADWEANRAHAQRHLSEAWRSLGAALGGLMMSKREPSREEQIDAAVELQRRHLLALRAEVKRLQGALEAAEERATTAERTLGEQPRAAQADASTLLSRLRRTVAIAAHPDKAGSAPEREWRTRLCQHLFPELDRVVRETAQDGVRTSRA